MAMLTGSVTAVGDNPHLSDRVRHSLGRLSRTPEVSGVTVTPDKSGHRPGTGDGWDVAPREARGERATKLGS